MRIVPIRFVYARDCMLGTRKRQSVLRSDKERATLYRSVMIAGPMLRSISGPSTTTQHQLRPLQDRAAFFRQRAPGRVSWTRHSSASGTIYVSTHER